MDKEIKILYKYAGDGIDYHYYGDKELLENIVHNMNGIEPFEQPDMIVSLDNKVLAIEHFEFDASSTNRKGSTDKRKLAERNRVFDNSIRNQNIGEEPVVSNAMVDCVYSSQYYIKNFKSVFGNHIGKIEDYKKNLVKMNMVEHVDNVIMCFFIVDTTPLGCYYLEDGIPKLFNLFRVSEYIELMTEHKVIDCAFAGYFDGNKHSLSFMSNSSEAIESIKRIKTIDFEKDKFFCFSPHETRFCVKVDK